MMKDVLLALGLNPDSRPSEVSTPVRSLEIIEHKNFDLGDCKKLYAPRNIFSFDNRVILHIKQRHDLNPENNFDRNEFIADQNKLERLILYLKENYNLDVIYAENISEELLRLIELMDARIESEKADQSHLPSDTWNLLLTYWKRISYRALPLDRRNRAACLYFIASKLNRELNGLRSLHARFKEDGTMGKSDNKCKKMFLNWNAAGIDPETDIFEKLELQCRRLEKHELLKTGAYYFYIGAVLKAFIDGKITVKPFLNFDSMKESPEIKKNQYIPIVCGSQCDIEKPVLSHNDCAENKLGLIEISPLY